MTDPSPRVVILAGPNGAGKTTSSRPILAETLGIRTFVNADTIAQGLSGFGPGLGLVGPATGLSRQPSPVTNGSFLYEVRNG